MTTSTSSAVWEGGLKSGKGTFSAGSGAFQGAYSFSTRFEGAKGTNPEELIAAAHAACLSMALAAGLEKAGTPATKISTTASCTVEIGATGIKITRMKLVVRGEVPGIEQTQFSRAAEEAKNGCPVSGAMKGNVAFDLDALLVE
ncbi:MAG TPA: OsmC family peroxiredoxin [Gemmatimonadales bacterium]|nr:OsmC family peroxiredoxin [Gemmatimonadales bacterium]